MIFYFSLPTLTCHHLLRVPLMTHLNIRKITNEMKLSKGV